MNSSLPLKVPVDPKAKPVVVHRASPVQVLWIGKVKAYLDREKVAENSPVMWQSRMHVVPKKYGS